MMRSDSKVEKVYLYSRPVDFRESINDLVALADTRCFSSSSTNLETE